jgi:hypothetical protein
VPLAPRASPRRCRSRVPSWARCRQGAD